MSDFDIRLRQYTPAGDAGPVLPTMGIDWTNPRGDIPSLTFKASEAVTGALPDLLEVAVEVWGGDGWIEPYNGRFFVLKNSVDDLDGAGIKSCTGAAMMSFILSNALLINSDGEDREVTGSAGTFLRTAYDEAVARGIGKINGKSFMAAGFAADKDSAGKAWSKDTILEQMSFGNGDKLSAILQILADQGILEYAFLGRILHVYNPGTGEDRSKGTGRVTVGSTSSELPVDTNLEDLGTHVVIRGDEGKSWTFPIPGAGTSMGRLEKGIDAGGVTSEAQAALLAELYQATGSAPRKQYTVTETAQAMTATPCAQFNPGDWVSARRPGGWERMRVTQLQVRKDNDGLIEVDVILADRLEDQATRIAKRNSALGARRGGNGSLGSGNSGGGYTAEPYMPTIGDGIGFGDQAPPTPAFTVTDVHRGVSEVRGVPVPSCFDGGNSVFGFKEQLATSIDYEMGQFVAPPITDRGAIELWSGYLHEGNLVDWNFRGQLSLDPRVMQDLWGGSSASIRPPAALLSVSPGGARVMDEYFVSTTKVTIYGNRQWFAEGWLYMPVTMTCTWRRASGRGMQDQHSARFIRMKVSDYLTVGPAEGVAGADLPGASGSVDVAAHGPQVAFRHAKAPHEGGSTVPAYVIAAGTFDKNTGDVDKAGFTMLPVNDEPGVMVIAPSLDGKGGMSLMGHHMGELQLGELIAPRTKETTWVPLTSAEADGREVRSFAHAHGRAISAGTDSGTMAMLSVDGLTGADGTPYYPSAPWAAFCAYSGGRLYAFHGITDGFDTWGSAKVTPVDPDKEPEPGTEPEPDPELGFEPNPETDLEPEPEPDPNTRDPLTPLE